MKRLAAAITVAVLTMTGCRFEGHKGAPGKDGDVKFETPFGGMSVKTDEKSAQAGVGLTAYPGAVLNHDSNNGKDSNAANVNMSFGNFHLGVKALSYQSGDAPDKVLAFYRKDMARYGGAILCRDHAAVGQPARTPDGLTCDTHNGKTVDVNEDGEEQLKAGSRLHQHIVSLEAKNGGTKIGLVSLDLPGNMDGEDSKE